MEHVISDSLLRSLRQRLDAIESIRNEVEYRTAMTALMDDEDALAAMIEEIVDSTVAMVAAINKGSGSTNRLPDEVAIAIARAIRKAAVMAFIAERYARDAIMDNSTAHTNTQFKRDYESLEDFLARRARVKNDITSVVLEAMK